MENKHLTIPNILTYIRIALIPVFVVLYFTVAFYWSLGVFILAQITDAADGVIARKFNMQSNVGKVLDPLADKLLKMAVLICFSISGVVPIWFTALVIAIDIAFVISGSMLFRKEIVVKSNIIGKSGTLILAVGVIMAFFADYLGGAHLVVLYVGLGILIASVLSYTAIYRRVFKKQKQSV